MDYIKALEASIDKTAEKEFLPLQLAMYQIPPLM
jgi:hypothetical protein